MIALRRSTCLLFVLLLAVGMDVHAQEGGYFSDEEHTFYGGFVAGLNFTQVDGDTYAGYHKVGFNGGGIVYARLGNNIGASIELIYTQKGSRGAAEAGSYALGTYIQHYYLDLNYVEIPVLFRFMTQNRLHFEVGASYGRLIKSSEELYSDPGMYIDPNIYYFHKSDICVVAGGSYQLYHGWFLEGRFQYSLTSIRDADRIPFGGASQLNNVVSLRLIRFFNNTNPR